MLADRGNVTRVSAGRVTAMNSWFQMKSPPLGAHLVALRRGFAHHGIYLGGGNVVHYRSMVRHFCRGPVEEVSLARFARERAIWVRSHSAPRFDGAEVILRARSRLGENRYRLFSNNCEHFCEWCLQDEHRSYQVESLLAFPRRLSRVWDEAIARLLKTAGWTDQLVCCVPSPTTAARNARPAGSVPPFS